MKESEIIRAWKDPEYRASLNEAELAALPAHPSGRIDLSDSELEGVAGGDVANTEALKTFGCCTTFFFRCGLTVGWMTLGCCPTEIAETA